MKYQTLAAPSEGVIREKMSKFMAFAAPVDSAEAARVVIARIANEYHDARHVCWAYMIGADRTTFLSSDNGEPSGTAGKPILGQINSFGLTNVVIAVVRYFGGIKLGTSGLIAAYREAARAAIEAAEIIDVHEMAHIEFTFPYLAMNDVMRVAKGEGVRIISQEFDNSCRMTVEVRLDDAPLFTSRFAAVDGVSIID